MILEIITKVKVICSLCVNINTSVKNQFPQTEAPDQLVCRPFVPGSPGAAGCRAAPLRLAEVCGFGCCPAQENRALPGL